MIWYITGKPRSGKSYYAVHKLNEFAKNNRYETIFTNIGGFKFDKFDNVKKQDFDESRLRVAKQIIKQNQCMTVDQLVGILRLLDFEKNKLELAKYAYHYIYDLENYYKVNNVFDFDSSIKKLDAYIKNQ